MDLVNHLAAYQPICRAAGRVSQISSVRTSTVLNALDENPRQAD